MAYATEATFLLASEPEHTEKSLSATNLLIDCRRRWININWCVSKDTSHLIYQWRERLFVLITESGAGTAGAAGIMADSTHAHTSWYEVNHARLACILPPVRHVHSPQFSCHFRILHMSEAQDIEDMEIKQKAPRPTCSWLGSVWRRMSTQVPTWDTNVKDMEKAVWDYSSWSCLMIAVFTKNFCGYSPFGLLGSHNQ